MQIGVIGSGSWATALVKILTQNGHAVHWWVRNPTQLENIKRKRLNPQYLPTVRLDLSQLTLSVHVKEVVAASELLVIAVPSAFLRSSLEGLTPDDWKGKKVLSAIKGLLPDKNELLNYFLQEQFGVALDDYFAVLGPCHAEEVAEEKLSYLTFSGIDLVTTRQIADLFSCDYINTIVSADIMGVQYAAVLKNIYALGAGIAHGLDYGDNFLSVYIANAADEMAGFLQQFGAEHVVVGVHEREDQINHRKSMNYAASVYLGDLLVTCYSPHSRNRRFGNMIGRGYSVKAAQVEMNMVAEGYQASRCIYLINDSDKSAIPIASMIYKILWEQVPADEGFKALEQTLI
ncbi:MAG: glycerol-3-phosphate dehydrogenase [Chitinophagales bacterium]|jgi:glycerol-3-phosphate dehydrogenase (NAD(P)+)|nr:glycerol-3-phosphate dehydrogenase [Chitinophagales bacterium]